jgi:hypothetical protein
MSELSDLEKKIIIVRAYRDLQKGAKEDTKTRMLWGMVHKHIPEFFEELIKKDQYNVVKDIRIGDFIVVVKKISGYTIKSLDILIKHLEEKRKGG